MHGVELVREVIAQLRRDGGGLGGNETVGVPPEKLAKLQFANGKPLSPSLKEWLSFDATFVDWFADPENPEFAPESFGKWTQREYGMDWGFAEFEVRLNGDCYAVPLGTDSRRCLYVGEPDSEGEYPIVLVDVDDIPYVGVEFPGIDVYLADALHMTKAPERVYGSYIKHATYGARMKEHADRLFDGQEGLEYHDITPAWLNGGAKT